MLCQPDDRSRSVELCVEGVQAEFNLQLDLARSCYTSAWQHASSDCDRCIAAHYVGHLEKDPMTAHAWNEKALGFAMQVEPDLVRSFMPSLLVSLGRTHELLGATHLAESFYGQAKVLGLDHSCDLLDGPWLSRLEAQQRAPMTPNNSLERSRER
jgi:hypothetical protein